MDDEIRLIIQDIKSGLTGRAKDDMKYLKEQLNKYHEHPHSKEILRAIGRMVYQILPPDSRREFQQAMTKDAPDIGGVMREVSALVTKGDYDGAIRLMEPMIRDFDEDDAFSDDAVTEYRDFAEPFEDFLYRHRTDSRKNLRHPGIPYSRLYFQYGNLLLEVGEYEKAREALSKAIRWNPVAPHIRFEYIETFKLLKDMESFFALTKDAMDYCYRPNMIARGYRNLAYYYVEKNRYWEATCCLELSRRYEKDSPALKSELFYIKEMNEGGLPKLTAEDIHAFCQAEDIPFSPARDILELAYGMGSRFLKEGTDDAAEYFLRIYYDLSDDPEVRRELVKLQKKNREKDKKN